MLNGENLPFMQTNRVWVRLNAAICSLEKRIPGGKKTMRLGFKQDKIPEIGV